MYAEGEAKKKGTSLIPCSFPFFVRGSIAYERAWLLNDQSSHHVALRRHGAFKTTRALAAGIKALEQVRASFAGVEGEGDRVGCGAVFCITRKRDVDIQLRNGEGVCYFIWRERGIGLPISIRQATDDPLCAREGSILWQKGIAKIGVLNGDRHKAVCRNNEFRRSIGRPVFLHAGLIDDDVEAGLHMFGWDGSCRLCGRVSTKGSGKSERDA